MVFELWGCLRAMAVPWQDLEFDTIEHLRMFAVTMRGLIGTTDEDAVGFWVEWGYMTPDPPYGMTEMGAEFLDRWTQDPRLQLLRDT